VKFLIRSLLALTLLYGMVFVIGDVYLLHHQLSIWWGIAFPIVFIGLQYLLAPALTEWVLSIDGDEDELPTVHRAFLEKLSAEHELPMPRVGVIHSATPNAFCFGRVRSDARIVVTEGLLNVLSEEEINAVLAHEVGHIAHYDFAVMAVAALAPLILYQLYVWTRHNSHTRPIAFSAYGCYWLSRFVVLALNRVREASADHYCAVVTREPNALSSALIKIAYGMLSFEYDYQLALKNEGKKESQKRFAKQRQMGSAISLLGIANLNSNRSLGLALSDPAKAAVVMRWDLVNPWASIYQLTSTHPLVAHRVRAMNREAEAMHWPVKHALPETQSEGRNWRFPIELSVWAAPWICGILLLFGEPLSAIARHYHVDFAISALHVRWMAPALLMALGVAWMIRIAYRYHGNFEAANVETLLGDVEVSEMRPKAAELRGEIVGNGYPGAFWSPDLVLKDETGLMFLLYRSSIPFGRLIFAVSGAESFIGEQVVVKGWYRRGLRPYVELSGLAVTVTKVEGLSGSISIFSDLTRNATMTRVPLHQRSYSRWIQYAVSAAVTATGLVWLLR
jgi:Zn-dependent protease with chaperone function